MIITTRKQFSQAVAAVLKANFPQLGTQEDMNGGDVVDALCELWSDSRRGEDLKGQPVFPPESGYLEPEPLNALRTAEDFIVGELTVMQQCYLPGPDESEAASIEEAEHALATVQAAIARLA